MGGCGCTGAGVCLRACSFTNQVMQRDAILPSAASLVPLYFSTLSHKRHDFLKDGIERKMCFDFLYNFLSETFFILRKIRRDIATNVKKSSCKVPVILVGFELNLNFLDRFSNKAKMLNFIKIRPVGAELLYVDGQTHMTKLMVAFRNFSNSSKKYTLRYTL